MSASTPPTITNIHGHKPAASLASSATTREAWLVHKLQHDWSSCDLGLQLTRDRVLSAQASFPQLEPVIKMRVLLAFLSMHKDAVHENEHELERMLDQGEKDGEEWVRVTAGIVRQYLFASDPTTESSSFLHSQLENASTVVLQAIHDHRDRADALVIEDFFCDENAYLSPLVRPEMTVRPAAHFTVCEDRDPKTPVRHVRIVDKKPTPRPLITSLSRTTSSSNTARLPPAAAKMPPKRSMTELSSEIRRKADAGRFKRQRSRISVIDLDEVKQLETEKALKAEEQRKKIKAAKEMKASAANPSQNAQQHGNNHNNAGVNVNANANANASANAAAVQASVATLGTEKMDEPGVEMAPVSMHGAEENDGSDAIMDRSRLASDSHLNYGQGGTQVLLDAAFHSTQEVMNEVVGHQQQHAFGHEADEFTHPAYAFPFPGAFGTQFHETPVGFGDHPPPYPPPASHSNGFDTIDEAIDEMEHGGPRAARFDGAFGSSRSTSGFPDGSAPPEFWR